MKEEIKELKRKNIFKLLFWILLILVIMSTVLGIIFQKQLFDLVGYQLKDATEALVDEKDKMSHDNVYIYDVDDKELYDLTAKYIKNPYCGDGLEFGAQVDDSGILFNNKSVTIDDIDDKGAAELIFWTAYDEIINNDQSRRYKNTYDDYITKDEIEKAKKNLFGQESGWDIKKMESYIGKWDDELGVLHFPTGFGGSCDPVAVNTKIVKAQKTGKNIEIFYRRLSQDDQDRFYVYKNGEKQYFNRSDLNLITETGEENNIRRGEIYIISASAWRKGNLYKVTFEQDPQDQKNYIFKSSEILE